MSLIKDIRDMYREDIQKVEKQSQFVFNGNIDGAFVLLFGKQKKAIRRVKIKWTIYITIAILAIMALSATGLASLIPALL